VGGSILEIFGLYDTTLSVVIAKRGCVIITVGQVLQNAPLGRWGTSRTDSGASRKGDRGLRWDNGVP